jgi:hypothetical protein
MAPSRKGSADKDTALVREDGWLYERAKGGEAVKLCEVGSETWRRWLQKGDSFYLEGPGVTFGCYERGDGKGNRYKSWIVSRSGQQKYVGKAQNIKSLEDLETYANALNNK